MKKFISIFLLFLLLGCIQGEKTATWKIHVIENDVTEYSLSALKEFETETIHETVVGKEVRKIPWEGVPSTALGDGEIINYISEDRYLVSIPSTVDVILAYKKEGDSIPKEDGGPLKITADPQYGCKCNWLKYLKIVEFVDRENTISIYGEVTNILYFSPRDLNIFYSLDALLEDRYHRAAITKILDKAICKPNAKTVTFVTGDRRETFDLSTIREENPEIVYNQGFAIPSLGLSDVRSIVIG